MIHSIASVLSILIVLLIIGADSVFAQRLAYVTNSNSSEVSVIDTETNLVIDTIPVGDGSQGVAITPDGTRAYVTGGAVSNNVSVIDTATNTIVDTITAGDGPLRVAITTLPPPPPPPHAKVPALSEWGMIIMASVMGIVGYAVSRRRMVSVSRR